MKKTEVIQTIITYNNIINRAIADRNIDTAAKFILKLRKLEIKDNAGFGKYRIGRLRCETT